MSDDLMESITPRNKKFEAQEVLKVYNTSGAFIDGALVQVLDFDTKTQEFNTYLVIELKHVGKYPEPEQYYQMYQMGFWVHENDICRISYDKPNFFKRFLKRLFGL